jgi:cytochrome c oxidase assembly protein subunit 11
MLNRANQRVALICAGVVIGMAGMAYASVPLYRLFCQVTGFAGTTQRAEGPSARILDRVVTVRFDANVGAGLPWTFEPVQNTVDVRIGETALAFYRVKNVSDHPVTGTATFNVTPDQAGGFFDKVQCFCFTEQRLEPGESAELPVSFFIDPAIVDDSDGKSIRYITLSYTFYPVKKPRPGLAGGADTGAGGGAAPPSKPGEAGRQGT